MENLFLILALFSLVALIVGLAKPSAIVLWSENKTRKNVMLVFGLATIVFFTAFGMIQPADTQTKTEADMFGYTQAELKEVYKEVVAAEDSARSEAEKECPTDSSASNYEQEKLEECVSLQGERSAQRRLEVLQQYSLTKDQWDEVSDKAIRENWPLE